MLRTGCGILAVFACVVGPTSAQTPATRDCPTCPEMVSIPLGPFTMGATGSELQRRGKVDDGDALALPPRPRQPEADIVSPAPASRPSIAIIPFALIGAPTDDAWLSDALPQAITRELSRLRWLFVLARGSSFRFRCAAVAIGAVGRALRVGCCLSGRLAAGEGACGR
mgnify:CR=1 FL=1